MGNQLQTSQITTTSSLWSIYESLSFFRLVFVFELKKWHHISFWDSGGGQWKLLLKLSNSAEVAWQLDWLGISFSDLDKDVQALGGSKELPFFCCRILSQDLSPTFTRTDKLMAEAKSSPLKHRAFGGSRELPFFCCCILT